MNEIYIDLDAKPSHYTVSTMQLPKHRTQTDNTHTTQT